MKTMTMEELNSFNLGKTYVLYLFSLKEHFISLLKEELAKEIKNLKINFCYFTNSALEEEQELTENNFFGDLEGLAHGYHSLIFNIPNHKTYVELYFSSFFLDSNDFAIDLYVFNDDDGCWTTDATATPMKEGKSISVLFSKECVKICSQWLLKGTLKKDQKMFGRF